MPLQKEDQKPRYDAWPHTPSMLDTLRATGAINRAQIKGIEKAFRAEDVAHLDPAFAQKMGALAAQLNLRARGKP